MIAHVQTAKVNSNLLNTVVTFGAGATAGNLLVAVISGVATGPGTKEWTSSGWSKASQDSFGGAGNASAQVEIMYKIAAGGETAVTFTGWGTSAWFTSIVMAEWSGIDTSSPLDVFANDGSNSASAVTSRATGTTGTTAQNDELAVAAVGQGNTVTALSWTNSFATRDSNAQAGSGVYLADKILSATGTVTSTASWTTSRIAGGCVATFKGSVVAGEAFVPRTIVF